MSPATIGRAEKDDPRVTAGNRSAIVQALAELAEERAALRVKTGATASLADQIEQHALAMMQIARKLRGDDDRRPVRGAPSIPPRVPARSTPTTPETPQGQWRVRGVEAKDQKPAR